MGQLGVDEMYDTMGKVRIRCEEVDSETNISVTDIPVNTTCDDSQVLSRRRGTAITMINHPCVSNENMLSSKGSGNPHLVINREMDTAEHERVLVRKTLRQDRSEIQFPNVCDVEGRNSVNGTNGSKDKNDREKTDKKDNGNLVENNEKTVNKRSIPQSVRRQSRRDPSPSDSSRKSVMSSKAHITQEQSQLHKTKKRINESNDNPPLHPMTQYGSMSSIPTIGSCNISPELDNRNYDTNSLKTFNKTCDSNSLKTFNKTCDSNSLKSFNKTCDSNSLKSFNKTCDSNSLKSFNRGLYSSSRRHRSLSRQDSERGVSDNNCRQSVYSADSMDGRNGSNNRDIRDISNGQFIPFKPRDELPTCVCKVSPFYGREKARLNTEKQQLKQAMDHTCEQRRQLELEEDTIRNMKSEIDISRKECIDKSKTLERGIKNFEEQKSNWSRLEEETRHLNEHLRKRERELNAKEKEITELSATVETKKDEVEAEGRSLLSHWSRMQHAQSELQKEHERLNDGLKRIRELSEIEARLNSEKSEIEKCKIEMNEQRSALDEETFDISQQRQRLNSEIQNLRESQESVRQHESRLASEESSLHITKNDLDKQRHDFESQRKVIESRWSETIANRESEHKTSIANRESEHNTSIASRESEHNTRMEKEWEGVQREIQKERQDIADMNMKLEEDRKRLLDKKANVDKSCREVETRLRVITQKESELSSIAQQLQSDNLDLRSRQEIIERVEEEQEVERQMLKHQYDFFENFKTESHDQSIQLNKKCVYAEDLLHHLSRHLQSYESRLHHVQMLECQMNGKTREMDVREMELESREESVTKQLYHSDYFRNLVEEVEDKKEQMNLKEQLLLVEEESCQKKIGSLIEAQQRAARKELANQRRSLRNENVISGNRSTVLQKSRQLLSREMNDVNKKDCKNNENYILDKKSVFNPIPRKSKILDGGDSSNSRYTIRRAVSPSVNHPTNTSKASRLNGATLNENFHTDKELIKRTPSNCSVEDHNSILDGTLDFTLSEDESDADLLADATAENVRFNENNKRPILSSNLESRINRKENKNYGCSSAYPSVDTNRDSEKLPFLSDTSA